MPAPVRISKYDAGLITLRPMTICLVLSDPVDFEAISDSFHETVKRFDIVSSRVFRHGEDDYRLHFSSTGAKIFEKRIDTTLEPNQQLEEYLLRHIETAEIGLGKGSLVSSFLEFRDCSVLSVSMSHVVADATSMGIFLNFWSQTMIGQKKIIAPMNCKFETRPGLSDGADQFSSELTDGQNDQIAWALKKRYFSKFTISDKILRSLNSESSDSTRLLSNFPLVAAAILKDHASSFVPDDNSITLSVPLDARTAHKDLSITHFGNALIIASINFFREELASEPVFRLATKIDTKIRQLLSPGYINDHLLISDDGTLVHRADPDNDSQNVDRASEIVASMPSKRVSGRNSIFQNFGPYRVVDAITLLPALAGFVCLRTDDGFTATMSSTFPFPRDDSDD